jgi:hypothetical protein
MMSSRAACAGVEDTGASNARMSASDNQRTEDIIGQSYQSRGQVDMRPARRNRDCIQSLRNKQCIAAFISGVLAVTRGRRMQAKSGRTMREVTEPLGWW